MDLTNDSYVILLHTRKATERYYRDARTSRDKRCWVKVSTQGNEYRATAEQVLNHLLPALSGLKPGVTVEVEYHPKRDGDALAEADALSSTQQSS